MSVEVYNDFMVCSDCYLFIANGDGPEYLVLERDGEAAYDARLAEITAGVERLQALCPGGNLVASGDEESDEEFSMRRCECCGEKVGGGRHKTTLLCSKTRGVGYGGHEAPSERQQDTRQYELGRKDASNELRSGVSDADIREYLASTRSEGGAYQRGYNEVMRAHLSSRGAGVGGGGLGAGLGMWNPRR